MAHTLKTFGHATLLVLQDGEPLVATDPWLIGSNYWRSWWLEKYPSEEEIDLVRRAAALYITHSHPDHFHWPSLRRLGPRETLHPEAPGYVVPGFLADKGFPARVMAPWTWLEVSEQVRIASVPVPINDSMLVVDTPRSVIVDINDCSPRGALLRLVKERLIDPDKRVIVLKSYSPASMGSALFSGDKRVPMKSKQDYADVARRMAEALGASYFVPFASQAFFSRSDSRWANDFKVTYEDLRAAWGVSPVELCPPFVTMDLATGDYTSAYADVSRSLSASQLEAIRGRESEEAAFTLPADFDARLKRYLDEVAFLRLFFRSGIGWRLTTSGTERFYNSRTREVENRIPGKHDFIVSLPDQVLHEALANNVLTDLGITMFIRVDTRVDRKMTYGAFLLMALHDYGHLADAKSMARCGWFYAPYLFPALLRLRRARGLQ
jgi:hypothetical protein